VAPPPPPLPDGGTTFAERCAGAGVVLCNGFDQESDIAPANESGIQTANDGTRQGFIDTSEKTSGAGSLKFTLRKGVTFANIGGAWSSTDMSKSFKPGDTLYIQWRQRVSSEYLSNNLDHWHSSIKQTMLHGPSATCQPSEFVTINDNNTKGTALWPSMYDDCGNGFNTDPTTNALCGAGNCQSGILIQQGSSLAQSPNGNGYNCRYDDQKAGDGKGSGCFYLSADTWYTYYERITLGALDTPATSVDAWVAAPGEPLLQFQRASGIVFPSGGDGFLSRVRVETYMTELPKGGTAATVDAFEWYDELIVSSQPIPAP
jgi:hypothetical protein